MNVQSAEKQINKLLDYVREIHSKNPTMYEKSKRRLNNISLTCNQIVHLISEILETEILANPDDTQEFGGEVEQNILYSVLSMEESLCQLKRFVTNNVSEFKTSGSYHTDIISRYLCIFTTSSSAYTEVRDKNIKGIIYLISVWLNLRFRFYGGDFKYNISDLAKWIRDIVVVYGYHVEHDTQEEFSSKFVRWCNGLHDASIYGVPYEVNSLSRNTQLYKKYLTSSSLLLWDKLIAFGADELCTVSVDDGYISEDDIYRLCEIYKPELVEEYENLKQCGGDDID